MNSTQDKQLILKVKTKKHRYKSCEHAGPALMMTYGTTSQVDGSSGASLSNPHGKAAFDDSNNDEDSERQERHLKDHNIALIVV